MTREWRPVVGWEGFYLVSNDGRVKSVARTVTSSKRTTTYPSKQLRPSLSLYGYLRVRLSDKSNGRGELVPIHRLVAKAFVLNPDQLETVNHIDGKKTRNRDSNLEWLSRGDNSKHGWRNGLMREPSRGEDHSNAKLTNAQAVHIRSSSAPAKSLATEFGVDVSTIHLIRRGDRYACA